MKGRQETLGIAQPNTLASMTKLVEVLTKQEKVAEAEALQQLALKGHRKAFGDAHPSTCKAMAKLAEVRFVTACNGHVAFV